MKINKKGFSLIELMVVIAIIGILATSGFSIYTSSQQKARDSTRITTLKELTLGIQDYYNRNGLYPGAVNNSCLSDGQGVPSGDLSGYYEKKKVPLDPQRSRKTGSCGNAGSYLYGTYTKDGFEKAAYILGANVEFKANANMLFNSSDSSYEDASRKIGAITEQEKNSDTNKHNIIYAIINA